MIFFMKSYFSAQLVSAQKLPALFLFPLRKFYFVANLIFKFLFSFSVFQVVLFSAYVCSLCLIASGAKLHFASVSDFFC